MSRKGLPVNRFALLPLALVVALSGCGGEHESSLARAGQPHVGEAVVGTNDPAGSGVELGDQQPGAGYRTGEPLLDSLDLAPPVGLGTAQASCSGTRLVPNAENLTAVRKATLCLINAERKARGLVALRLNSELALAAVRHSRDMVKNKYFAHTSPSGATFVQRIKKAGYMTRYTSWTVGENLAWGAGTPATPAEIVRAWMQSRAHRANILNGKFRHAGFGIVVGVPVSGFSGGATYSNEFGRR
jgi:uncharacterized protein YkwD